MKKKKNKRAYSHTKKFNTGGPNPNKILYMW